MFIAKGIVNLHGGRIWAESEGEGKGTVFKVSAVTRGLSTAFYIVLPCVTDHSLPSTALAYHLCEKVQLPAMEPSPALGKSGRTYRKLSLNNLAAAASPGTGRGLTILIVDDSELNRKVSSAYIT